MIKFDKILKRIDKISQKISILNARILSGVFEPLALGAADGDVEFDNIRIFGTSARASVSYAVAVTNLPAALALGNRHKLRRRRRCCGGFGCGF